MKEDVIAANLAKLHFWHESYSLSNDYKCFTILYTRKKNGKKERESVKSFSFL